MSKVLVYRRLYRSLLKVAKPFADSSPKAAVVSCLLHRTGIDDSLDFETLAASKAEKPKEGEGQAKRSARPLQEARDLSKSYADTGPEFEAHDPTAAMKNALAERKEPHRILLRRLLREAVAGSASGLKQMQFPKQVQKNALQNVIMREFRLPSEEHLFDLATRQQVAFLALRELNKKLARFELLEAENDTCLLDEDGVHLRNQRQAAKHVSPLPLEPEEYLMPGSFLIAHPLLTGYFRRTVICILDHTDQSSALDGGTYGLIVNRIGVSPQTGKDQTLKDVLRTIPPKLLDSFGECAVRDGGPVHMSLQMVHSTKGDAATVVGGTVLQMLTEDEESSAALHSDRAIYYQGDILQAAEAVKAGSLDRDDVCFYAGASCWELRQLESEIERGFWIPCRGPPEIALTGTCEHNDDDLVDVADPRPKADLWLSMMCAMGQDEANLAHLMLEDDFVEDGDPCDSF